MVASMVEIKAGPARAMVYILGEKQTKAKWKVKKKKKQKRSQSEGDSGVTLQEQNETK